MNNPCHYCNYKSAAYFCPCKAFEEWQREQEKEVLKEKKEYSYNQKYNET